jgi:cytochrome c556
MQTKSFAGSAHIHQIVIEKDAEYMPKLARWNVNPSRCGERSDMKSNGIWGLLAAAMLTVGLSSTAMAELGPVEARQACMKANVGVMKVAVPIIKGAAAYDKAALDKAFAAEQAACGGWANWWGEDTKPGGAVKTEAKLEIWTDKAGFEAATANFVKASESLAATADEASFKAAFPDFGKACQSCHEKYRAAD